MAFYDIIKKKGELLMKKIVSVILVFVLIGISGYFLNPELRVRCFVEKYSDEYSQWDGYPNNIGINYSNCWDEKDGKTGMHEMILFSVGKIYYGCYYSLEDKPYTFQNMDYELVPDGDGRWEWSGDDGLHGETEKIKDNWYYFKTVYQKKGR